jgi:hypothetical protein
MGESLTPGYPISSSHLVGVLKLNKCCRTERRDYAGRDRSPVRETAQDIEPHQIPLYLAQQESIRSINTH